MDEPGRPSVADLIEINRLETGITGEPHGVLSLALLESVWAKPAGRWAYEDEADLVRLAVSLTTGVGQNHPFKQGSKRSGFGGGSARLRLNGHQLARTLHRRELADACGALIAHESDEPAFAELLRPHVVDCG